VPYLNVETHIEGHPHDKLLKEKGYSGHPTLAFMNAEGEVLGRPLDRSVASFEATLTAIADFAELERREAAGEKGLEFERFVLERALMKLRGKKLTERGKALRGLTEEQQATVDAILLGVEVDDLVLKSLGGTKDVNRAGKRMLEILDSGRCPDMVKDANAWSVLARYAENIKDADLIDRCSKGLGTNFPDSEQMQSWSRSLAEKARALHKDS